MVLEEVPHDGVRAYGKGGKANDLGNGAREATPGPGVTAIGDAIELDRCVVGA